MPIAKYDSFLTALRKREIHENVSLEVFDEKGVSVTVTGIYLICDGGDMKESYLIDPYNFRSSRGGNGSSPEEKMQNVYSVY